MTLIRGGTAIRLPIGGAASKPIKTQTTYTLTCLDLQNGTQQTTAPVHILPIIHEI